MKRSGSVEWTCWQPTPYNDFFFEQLSQHGPFDLMVHFRDALVTSHPWTTNFATGYRSRVFQRRLGIDWHLLHLALRTQAFFVMGGWDDPTSIAVLNVLMARRRAFAIWTDTPSVYGRRSGLARQLRSTWLRRVFEHASVVMGTGSPALAALAEMGCPEHKLRNLPYSIDVTRYRPSTRTAASQVTVFVSCGRLHQDKGYDLALKALARLSRTAQIGPFVYRIAGTGPHRDQLQLLAAELGLQPSVEFLGWVEPGVLPELYETADVLLHPARREPYGVTVLEAMAAGLAVVASDATAAAVDRIKDGVNGFLHESGNEQALALAIRRATEDRAALERVRAEARATAECWPVSKALTIVRDALSMATAR